MQITEKDLFLYVWNPVNLVSEKFKYLEDNYQKFNEEIDLMIDFYKHCLMVVDNTIIQLILEKINLYNEEQSYSVKE